MYVEHIALFSKGQEVKEEEEKKPLGTKWEFGAKCQWRKKVMNQPQRIFKLTLFSSPVEKEQ